MLHLIVSSQRLRSPLSIGATVASLMANLNYGCVEPLSDRRFKRVQRGDRQWIGDQQRFRRFDRRIGAAGIVHDRRAVIDGMSEGFAFLDDEFNHQHQSRDDAM